MRLNDRWHQILGVHDGGRLSGAADCNAYGLETSAGLVMFDAGAGIRPAAQLSALDGAGFPGGPQHLFLTHAHADHSGGAADLVSRYGMPVHAGKLTARWVGDGAEDKFSLPVARRAGVYPPDYAFRAVRVDRVLDSASTIRIGDAEITAIATPGHSADHMSYLVRVDGQASLIAGDAIFAGGTIVLQDTWDSSVADSCASIRRLAGFEFERLLSGHGPLVLERAREHVEIAMERISRLLPPRNLT